MPAGPASAGHRWDARWRRRSRRRSRQRDRCGLGGLLDGSQSTDAITALLQDDATSYTWAAAAVGSNSAAGYQLATEQPVMAIGGFNGSDPSPTLAQFQEYVADGEIHWFIAGGGGMGGGMGGPGRGGSVGDRHLGGGRPSPRTRSTASPSTTSARGIQ